MVDTNNDGWVEAGVMDNQAWTPEVNETLEGIYTAVETGVGANKSNVYAVQEDGKDEPTKVWGSIVLDDKFKEIPVGSPVKVTFLGEQKGSGPKPYKKYVVMYKPTDPFEE